MFSNTSVTLDSLPSIDEVIFNPLDRNAKWEALLSTFIFFLPLSVGGCLFLWYVLDVPTHILISVISLAAVANIVVFFYIGMLVNKTGIALREHDFLLRKGIIWQKTIIVPFNRIQHIETHRNPFERKLALASLKLFTAGGRGADLQIHGLNVERASKIRQFILKKEQGNSHE